MTDAELFKVFMLALPYYRFFGGVILFYLIWNFVANIWSRWVFRTDSKPCQQSVNTKAFKGKGRAR